MEEQKYLLYVELPNIINRIYKLAAVDKPVVISTIKKLSEELKKVSNAEINSGLETIEKLLSEKSPLKDELEKPISIREKTEKIRKHLEEKDEDYKKLLKRYDEVFLKKIRTEIEASRYRVNCENLKKQRKLLIALNIVLTIICLTLSVLAFI